MSTGAGRRRVRVGDVVGVHGVRGWLKVRSHCEPREQLLRYSPWIVVHGGNERSIDKPEARVAENAILVHIPGIDDRDQALIWRGAEIWVERDALGQLGENEFYWHDLEGLRVSNREGVILGIVDRLFPTGANDVLVVRDGKRERLIPYVWGQYVDKVDLAASTMVVDWDPEF